VYCYLLQNWTTIRVDTSLTLFTQAENDYFDATGFQDLIGWLEVKEATFSTQAPTLSYQTAPTKDDAAFQTMATVANLSVPGVSTTPMLKELTVPPLARWLRWQLQCSSSGTWDLTFRIFCALNAIGENRPGMHAW
jgi:hypothetical protein